MGPVIGVATETFESFNSVFRAGSVFSNHLAPSRDIARRLADQESTRHQIMGGMWPSKDGTWSSAGAGVQELLQSNPVLKSLLGVQTADPIAGVSHSLPLTAGSTTNILIFVRLS